jgi:hypothetical protein
VAFMAAPLQLGRFRRRPINGPQLFVALVWLALFVLSRWQLKQRAVGGAHVFPIDDERLVFAPAPAPVGRGRPAQVKVAHSEREALC